MTDTWRYREGDIHAMKSFIAQRNPDAVLALITAAVVQTHAPLQDVTDALAKCIAEADEETRTWWMTESSMASPLAKHDLTAHWAAGGFGVVAEGCPGCAHRA